MSRPRAVLLAAALLVAAMPVRGQVARPRATLTPVIEAAPVVRGTTRTVRLDVMLPDEVHVQAHEPRDPLLIPTVLEMMPPAGVKIDDIVYPKPSELTQAGRSDPLLVLGPRFSIDVRVTLSDDVPAGELALPAVLRYQACNDTVCFPPARAPVEWRLAVAAAR